MPLREVATTIIEGKKRVRGSSACSGAWFRKVALLILFNEGLDACNEKLPRMKGGEGDLMLKQCVAIL